MVCRDLVRTRENDNFEIFSYLLRNHRRKFKLSYILVFLQNGVRQVLVCIKARQVEGEHKKIFAPVTRRAVNLGNFCNKMSYSSYVLKLCLQKNLKVKNCVYKMVKNKCFQSFEDDHFIEIFSI